MAKSYLLPAQNNFADLRETVDRLARSTKDSDLKRLAGIIGISFYRCDMLEREVERLGREIPASPSASTKKTPGAKKSSR